MENNLFDNENDWLSQERRRESRIKPLDINDGAGLKEEHYENCEVEELANQHINIEHNKKPEVSPEDGQWFGKAIVNLFITLFISANLSVRMPWMIIPFIWINPGIFVWLFLLRKFPPKIYWQIGMVLSWIIILYSVLSRIILMGV